MPRKARILSESGIYHVIMRGINRQDIFLDEEDYRHFLKVLAKVKEASGFELYAYCLMSNHVHLLLRTGSEKIGQIMLRLCTRFVYWYNIKYERVGHLFQDRFRSEPVDSERYFLTVLRYVLQNPMKAGLEPRPGHYRWTSYEEYRSAQGDLTDIEYPLKLLESWGYSLDFLLEKNEDTALEMSFFRKWRTDEDARKVFEEVTGCTSGPAFQQLGAEEQKKCFRLLAGKNISVRQLSRITGISRRFIQRAIR